MINGHQAKGRDPHNGHSGPGSEARPVERASDQPSSCLAPGQGGAHDHRLVAQGTKNLASLGTAGRQRLLSVWALLVPSNAWRENILQGCHVRLQESKIRREEPSQGWTLRSGRGPSSMTQHVRSGPWARVRKGFVARAGGWARSPRKEPRQEVKCFGDKTVPTPSHSPLGPGPWLSSLARAAGPTVAGSGVRRPGEGSLQRGA